VLPVCLSCLSCHRPWSATSSSEQRDLTAEVLLSAGRGRPARTPFGFLVRALPVVASTKCGESCLSLVGPRICQRVGGTRDMPVEVLFPEGRERLELASSSGWSRVLGIDAVGGAPHCDFADEGGARVASRCSPGRLGVTLAGVVLDLVGEVGDQLGSLGQVCPQTGWAWSISGMPGSQASGPGLGGVSSGRRQ
jgi:hypothetical protein